MPIRITDDECFAGGGGSFAWVGIGQILRDRALNTPRTNSLVASRRAAVDRTLAGLKLLPSNAAVAMKVLELKRRGDAGAADLARVIAADAGLAAKILAVANSAAFAPVSPITRLSIAIAQIGLNNLLPLVFGLSVGGIFNKLSVPLEDQAHLWRSSMLKAVTARACVRRICGPFKDNALREAAAEEAFLAALFQDIALPVFYAADRSAWSELLTALDLSDDERAAQEQAIYGIDHATLAASVARTLGLPELFVITASSHHMRVLGISAAGAEGVAIAIDAAASLPHRLPAFSGKLLSTLCVRLKFTTKASDGELRTLVGQITDDYLKTTALFGRPEDASASYKEFLQNLGTEVAECLQSSIISSATEICGLKEHQRRLGDAVAALEDKKQQAEFDPLTKVLTRAAFHARLDKLIPMARRHGATCAVGFLDLDNFKGINDTHGHCAGDAALVAAAALLLATLKDTGIAGRIGGDEFVFAFVARPEVIDASIASIVESMARIRFIHDKAALQVTTSIGVHPMGIPDAEATADSALRAADELMYQAKRAGKGRGAIGKRQAAEALVGA